MDILHRHTPHLSRGDQAVNALKQIGQDAERDRFLLLSYVLGGKRKFVNIVRRELRGMAITDKQLELLWIWLWYRKGPDPAGEYERLCLDATARKNKQEAEEAELAMLYERARRRMD